MMNDNDEINMLSEIRTKLGELDGSCGIAEIEVLLNKVQESLITKSAGVMPKVFDEWITSQTMVTTKVGLLVSLDCVFHCDTGEDLKLAHWLYDEYINNPLLPKEDVLNDDKYIRCVEAIIHGYEVEK